MSTLQELHAEVADEVFADALDVEFRLTTPGTYDEDTDTYSDPLTKFVLGKAFKITGDQQVYRDLGLTQLEPMTLLFRPEVFGELPGLGYMIDWDDQYGGTPLVVKAVDPVAPTGDAIVARVVVSR